MAGKVAWLNLWLTVALNPRHPKHRPEDPVVSRRLRLYIKEGIRSGMDRLGGAGCEDYYGRNALITSGFNERAQHDIDTSYEESEAAVVMLKDHSPNRKKLRSGETN